MKRWNAACLLLLLVWPLCGWSQQVVRTIPVVLQLDVNANGQVTFVTPMSTRKISMQSRTRLVVVRKPSPPLPGVLAKAVRQIAMRWRFKAREVNGKSVSGRTWAKAKLEIVKRTAKTYGVRLKYQSNGPYIYSSVAPNYPVDGRMNGEYAGVVLEAVIEPDNTISDIHVVSVHGNVGAITSRPFRKAAITAMKKWKGYAEQIDGHAVATRIRIPMMFWLDGMPISNEARIEKAMQRDVRPQGTPKPVDIPFKSGQAVALNSPFVKQPPG